MVFAYGREMTLMSFASPNNNQKADKKHDKPEGSKTNRMQDKRDGKAMPASMMKKSGK